MNITKASDTSFVLGGCDLKRAIISLIIWLYKQAENDEQATAELDEASNRKPIKTLETAFIDCCRSDTPENRAELFCCSFDFLRNLDNLD